MATSIRNEARAIYAAGTNNVRPPQVMSDAELVEALTGEHDLDLSAGLSFLLETRRIADVAVEFANRVMMEKLAERDCLTSSALVRNYLRGRLRHCEREVFLCLFLDNQNRVIAAEELFYGTIDGATIHPRVVVSQALKHNAAAVIFAHNHPSGVAEPSQADVGITRRLKNSLGLIDVRVLDHIVIGGNEAVSLAERGLI